MNAPSFMLALIIPLICLAQSAVAGMSLLALDVSTTVDEQIYGRLPLLGCCIIGSSIGAFLAVGSINPEKYTQSSIDASSLLKQVSFRFGTSQLSGMVFTPMLMRYFKFAMMPDSVVGVSAIVAFISVSALNQVNNASKRYIQRKLDKMN